MAENSSKPDTLAGPSKGDNDTAKPLPDAQSSIDDSSPDGQEKRPRGRRRRRRSYSTTSSSSERTSSSGSSSIHEGPFNSRYELAPWDAVTLRRREREERRRKRREKRRERQARRERSGSRSDGSSHSLDVTKVRRRLYKFEDAEDHYSGILDKIVKLIEKLDGRLRGLEDAKLKFFRDMDDLKDRIRDIEDNNNGGKSDRSSVNSEVDEPKIGDQYHHNDGDDSDDEKSDNEYDEEVKPQQVKPDLAVHFFYNKNPVERQAYYNRSKSIFMRVRWDDLHVQMPTNADRQRRGDLVPGSVDLMEITLGSVVMKNFFDSMTTREATHPHFPGVPPPPMVNVGRVSPRKKEVDLEEEDDTICFFKPFRYLIQNRQRFHDELSRRESQLGRTNDERDTPDAPNLTTPDGSADTKAVENCPENYNSRVDFINQLRTFLNFMDEYLGGSMMMYEDMRAGRHKTVSFENLWMLYTPGDIIYTPFRKPLPSSEPPKPPAASRIPANAPPVREGVGRPTPQAYKVIAVVGGRLVSSPPAWGNPSHKPNWYTELKLICYFIDFNGVRYDVITDTFTIRPFNGELDMRDLDVYPLTYASMHHYHDESSMIDYLKQRGRKFIECSEVSHKLYEGLTIDDTREEINTPVIIDFLSCYQSSLPTRPQFSVPIAEYFWSGVPGMGMAKPQRPELHEIVTKDRQKGDWYWQHQLGLVSKARNDIFQLLNEYPSITPTDSDCIGRLQTIMEADGHILLLPGMVYGFALRNRKWVCLELDLTQEIQYEAGWNDLILPKGHKEMVRAVVENHATGSRSTIGMAKAKTEVDIVRGKGKGCIILLHGEPGVGKTSTAECVAAFTKRPLFPITCGDIGYEPETVESHLEKHFKLAHKWGCVMLLDEADVFLAKRSREDLKRNGLVSIFLRILEYYPGILFLTTNRVGAFDDAFRSRLHLSLYYPKLDRSQTIRIWKMNLRRVSELSDKRASGGLPPINIERNKILRFARHNWKKLSWNGRQIRNAFQTAIALSEFDVRGPDGDDGGGTQDGEKDKEVVLPVMGVKQFRTIAKASMQFDDYLFYTHGSADEAANARKEMVRYDYEMERRHRKDQDLSSGSSGTDSFSSGLESGSDDDDDPGDGSGSGSGGSDSLSSDNDRRRKERRRRHGKGKKKESEKDKDRGKKSKSGRKDRY